MNDMNIPAVACVCKHCGLKFAATSGQDDCGHHDDPSNWDCCDDHETVFLRGSRCPECDVPHGIKQDLAMGVYVSGNGKYGS